MLDELDKDAQLCLYCGEIIIGLILAWGLPQIMGPLGVATGLGFIVLLCTVTAYADAYFKKKRAREHFRAIQQIETNAANGRLLQFQANAKKLVDLFTMSTNVAIDDVRTIMEFDSRKETLELLLALKQRVPGLMLDGNRVVVPNVQELTNALNAYAKEPATEEKARAPQPWTCKECKHENPTTANFCEACGYQRTSISIHLDDSDDQSEDLDDSGVDDEDHPDE